MVVTFSTDLLSFHSIPVLPGTGCDHVKEFSCRGGRGMCIASYLSCDGVKDCPNGEDEADELCREYFNLLLPTPFIFYYFL